MEEEQIEEMPVADEEPQVTTTEGTHSEQKSPTELENAKDSLSAEVEMASDEKNVQESETGGESVAAVNTDPVEDGDKKESENQEAESKEANIEDAPAQVAENGEDENGEDKDNGLENDGTAEREEKTEGGNQTSPGEEENEEDQITKSGSQPGSQPDPQQQTAEEEPKSPLPESSTFGEGERPETPVVAVTVPLSREGSPVQEPPQTIPPGTPERIRSPVIEEDRYEEYEEEEEEQLEPREKIVEHYQAAIAEREQLLTTNMQFQHKLAEYFRKKKTDDQRQEMDKNVTDQEQRYLKYMSNLEELRKQEEEERRSVQEQLEDLRFRKDEKLHLVDSETCEFAEFKKQTAVIAINSRTGKSILPKDVEQYLLNEVKKEDEVKQVRLENIKLKNRLKKREQQLKAKEELAEGLHLIDFEQLKIENQTYNEKIEERNEELLKLRKKITSTVQVLTHVKEKLQFVQAENQVQKAKLKDVEELVAKKRDILSRTKKARDCLRIDNQRQMQKCGLLGNKPLLHDFEERKDEGDDLRARLEYLKRRHAELTLDSNGLKKKIEAAKSVRN